MTNNSRLITILGPTAVGKTKIAATLAHRQNGEIISGDSRQVYREMDIGTGKDIADYTINGENIPYHLIDIVDAGYKYNVFEYQRDFFKVYHEICRRGKQPILCGGTGMYIESVVNAYQMAETPPNTELRNELGKKSHEELIKILSGLKSIHNKTDFDTRKRAIRAIEIEIYKKKNKLILPKYEKPDNIYFGIDIDVETRRKRITNRLNERLESGMIEEVRFLINSGVAPDDIMYYGLEYKYLTLYIIGKLGFEEMKKQLNVAIHQFAKRQMTWFRGMERKGAKINWIDGNLPVEKITDKIEKML